MKVCGQSLWNVTPICEMVQICHLMGRRPTKDALENLLKDKSFRLHHWLSITYFCERSQESINLERKFFLDCSLDTLSTRREFGRVTYWSQTLTSWKRWTHWKFIVKDQMHRRCFSQRKWKIHLSSRRWTNQTFWRRSETENIHFDTGTPNSRRRSR